jgi:hypothetical protein
MFSARERYVVHALLESSNPRTDGPPAVLAAGAGGGLGVRRAVAGAPRPFALRLLLALLLALAVVAVCFVWVFPAAAPYVPFNDTTVEDTTP